MKTLEDELEELRNAVKDLKSAIRKELEKLIKKIFRITDVD
jgi:hypothetical protein